MGRDHYISHMVFLFFPPWLWSQKALLCLLIWSLGIWLSSYEILMWSDPSRLPSAGILASHVNHSLRSRMSRVKLLKCPLLSHACYSTGRCSSPTFPESCPHLPLSPLPSLHPPPAVPTATTILRPRGLSLTQRPAVSSLFTSNRPSARLPSLYPLSTCPSSIFFLRLTGIMLGHSSPQLWHLACSRAPSHSFSFNSTNSNNSSSRPHTMRCTV